MATTKQDLFNDELAALLDKWYPEIYTVEFNDFVSFDGFYINIDIEPKQTYQKELKPFGLDFSNFPDLSIR
tara:strand:- start:42 stop:254 length:213 start_codon:yes stop_codon:yes gene_type:complete